MPKEIPQVSFGGGIIAPEIYARVDINKYGSAVADAVNMFVLAEGGISNRAGLKYIKSAKDSTKTLRLIPFEFNEEQAYCLEFSEYCMRVYQNGGLVLESNQNITGATQANPVEITITGHSYSTGDEVYINSVGGMTELNEKFYIITSTGANTFTLNGIDGTGYSAYTSGGTGARVFELTTPYDDSDLDTLKFRQSNDVMYLAHRSFAPRKLSRTGAAAWTISTMTFTPDQAAPTSVTTTPQGTTGSTTYQYRVTAVAQETAEESLVANTSTSSGNANLSSTNFNRITWTGASGAESYSVYKEDNGLYGYIGSTETTTFDDKNIAADLDDTAPKLRQPFNSANDYPGAVGLHEERSVWGNTTDNPLAAYLSQTSQFENFNVSSPTRASDAVTVRLITGQGNEIRHFRSFQERLFIFTSGALWSMRPGGDADAITPTSKQLQVEEYISSTDIPPITIQRNILMVSGQANQGFDVKSLGYLLETDAYTGNDLTVLARHLFKDNTIVEWAYAERPYRLLAAVRNDGKLLCLTYMEEQRIYAWTVWETDGLFKSVTSVPEGQDDRLYFVVERTISSSAV